MPTATINLSEAQNAILENSVMAGDFADVDQAVQHVFDQMQRRDQTSKEKLIELRKAIEIGDQGEDCDGEEFFDELLAEAPALQKAS